MGQSNGRDEISRLEHWISEYRARREACDKRMAELELRHQELRSRQGKGPSKKHDLALDEGFAAQIQALTADVKELKDLVRKLTEAVGALHNTRTLVETFQPEPPLPADAKAATSGDGPADKQVTHQVSESRAVGPGGDTLQALLRSPPVQKLMLQILANLLKPAE